jgi:hypothetical protein
LADLLPVQQNALPPFAEERQAIQLNSSQDSQTRNEPLGAAWKAFAYTSIPLVKDLLGVYFETVFPMYAFWATFPGEKSQG